MRDSRSHEAASSAKFHGCAALRFRRRVFAAERRPDGMVQMAPHARYAEENGAALSFARHAMRPPSRLDSDRRFAKERRRSQRQLSDDDVFEGYYMCFAWSL